MTLRLPNPVSDTSTPPKTYYDDSFYRFSLDQAQRISKMMTAGAIGRIVRPVMDQLKKVAKLNVPKIQRNKSKEEESR